MSASPKIPFWTIAIVSAGWALPVMAAETSDSNGGLPQFDTTYFPGQLFWLAISFALLYVLMTFVALPKVRQTQDRRQQTLAAELDVATAASEKAKAIIAQYEKALADARHQAQVTVTDIMTQGAKASAERQSQQHQELQKRLRAAEAKIHAARDMALTQIESTVGELAESMIKKVTGKDIRVRA